jgi:cytochrome P450
MGAALVKGSGHELNPDLIQNNDGERHSRLRGAFSHYYGAEHRITWGQIIEREARETLDTLEAPFDLRSDFFEPVARRSAKKIFGFQPSKQAGLRNVSFNESGMLDLEDQVCSILRSCRYASSDSYSHMIPAIDRYELLSQSELVSNLAFFISLTFDAVAAPFLGGVFAMLRDRDQWNACLQDRSLLANAVSEILRCYPVGDGQFLRIAMDKVTLSDVAMQRGDAVLAPAPAANVDPAVFPNSRRFDVRRPNSNKHVAFGVGLHHCLGSFLVEVWIRTALSTLLDRMPTLRLAVAPASITYRPIPFVNIMERLPVTY